MKTIRFFLILATGLAVMPAARSTTVIPPSFAQLVEQAEVIFQGSVTDVKSQWVGEGAQRHIMSYVTFNVEDSLKGAPGQTYTIRMFGGTVDGVTMAVSDAPKFSVGDRNILFVENNGTQFIPLVGIMHGQFKIEHASDGSDVVVPAEGAAVKDVARLGREQTGPDRGGADLSPDQFKAAVRTQLQASSQQPAQ
jgi:hypothetical protein